jgi:type II secretory pathway component GspD/PulD (secretin)
MRLTSIVFSLSLQFCLMFAFHVSAQEKPVVAPQPQAVVTVKPNFLPPPEILDFLGVRDIGGRGVLEWRTADGRRLVEIRSNDAANILILTGAPADVQFVERLIKEADVAPRQIEIEVKIVEVSTSKAQDLGIDWDQVLERSRPRVSWRYDHTEQDYRADYYTKTVTPTGTTESFDGMDREIEQSTEDLDFTTSLYISDVLKLLDQSGAATIRSAPRILTLNNRRATILDGERVTYVTRYSSYTNLFETDSMDAGLTMSVTPSLGESGYITLNVRAELTSLNGSISGSPIKSGQIVENVVIVKDGESVLLGGLSRSVDETIHKRFPLLGHVLPFLFSRDITIKDNVESYIVLRPRVVDFSTAIKAETKAIIEGE